MTTSSRPSFFVSGARRALLHAALSGASREPRLAGTIQRGDRREYPLTFAQERLWFLDRFQPGRSTYNVPLRIALGRTSVALVSAALEELVRRHSVLRTHIELREQGPVQVIEAPGSMTVPFVDLSGLPEALRDERCSALQQQELHRPFDLQHGPLFRVVLVRLGGAAHVLIVTFHHIITDARSLGIFGSDLAALLEGLERGGRWSLPELPVQYGDFAAWQREEREAARVADDLAFWRGHLGSDVPVLELPADRARPAIQTHEGALQYFHASRSTLARLQRICREESATPFMVTMAAFLVLLHRYSRQSDLVLGTPVANRDRPETEGLIGFFVNTLAIRVAFDPRASFRELVRLVRTRTLEAYAHQDVPFEQLVQELVPTRSLSHNPLFQVMFSVVQESHSAPVALELRDVDDPVEPLEPDPPPVRHTAKFDLNLTFAVEVDRWTGVFEYNTDLFDNARILRMVGHLRQLLDALGRNPDEVVERAPILSEAELAQLEPWSHGERTAGAPHRVHERVDAVARATPAARAVVGEGFEVSYARLAQASTWLARRLVGAGARPGEPLALSVARDSRWYPIAVVAILKAGGAYLPLDPSLPASVRRGMLTSARCSIVVTDAPGRESALELDGLRCVTLDAQADRDVDEAGAGDAPPLPTVDARCVAYVVFTSGSTGRPKGVMMSHGALDNLVEWQTSASPPEAAAVTLQFSACGFDVAVQELFATLCCGGTLVLLDDARRRDPRAMVAHIRRFGVTRMFLPYIALAQLADAFEADIGPTDSLREVITAGEQLKITAAIRRMFERRPGCRLYNQYGPSETHVATAYALPPEPASWPLLPPIGRPIPNLSVHVLDPGGNPCPVGIPGELLIAGAQVAEGYINLPRETGERFVELAVAPDRTPRRMYRTGDLVQLRPDGELEFLGRLDHQVKIRGHRVEPGEVEIVLCEHAAVEAAAVAPRTDASGTLALVAYVVVRQPIDPLELRRFLEERLLAALVPSQIVLLPELPRTSSGKVRYESLPAVDGARRHPRVRQQGPRTELERQLAGIWSAVLGVESVGPLDDFFELGGHSLSATQVVARLRVTFGVDVPVLALFERPTIEALIPQLIHALLDALPPVDSERILAEVATGSAPSTIP